MSKKLILTVPAYENLLAHLVDFEERRSQMINLYFPDFNKPREEFEILINNYINDLEAVVENVLFSDETNNDFPFVCLNSEVEIEDTEELETYRYKIIAPETGRNGNNCITILSPLGKALLCRTVQEVFTVNTPSGVYRYRIKSIKLQER